ncbi:MAG: hypothetical protein AAF443_08800, partial [Chlamydiota bacterium]
GQKPPARGEQRQSKTFLKDEFIAKALWMRRKKAFGKVFVSPSGRFLPSTETTRGELGLSNSTTQLGLKTKKILIWTLLCSIEKKRQKEGDTV